ncbi:type IC specificity subunit protein [Lacticaseibacillus paracasei subsp. paracasei Lpp14]|uniref:Type IC specificity subunit protein n=1 Tax=Lacticaseibacillus paracasei subsp. paracasei Lpp14 TaxID=1256204 RepID=A0A829GMG9_LACPA|nr:type IC specificity subunit protein [Lacticaseibacillus paracasei subsp. paracasei Lpp14]
MNAEQHVPQFRFKGFSDSWEQHKLSDGTNKIGDGLHGTPKYSEDGDVYFVNGNNLVNGQIVITSETKRVTSNEQSKDDKALNENTILMSINGTIGNLAWYRGENLMLGKSAAYIEVSDFDKKFIYTYLQTRPVKDYYLNSLTGTTIKNLGLKAIRNTNIYTPTIDEQAKIGVLFQNLDMTITLHQRKLAKLKELKKGYLQKLFPQNSEKVPEFRFKGYSDALEKRKLGEVATITMGQSPDSKNYTLNPQDHILVQGNADIKNGWVEPRVWTTQITKIAKKGSVLLSVRAPVGEVSKTAFDVVLGRGVASVGQTDFLYQYLITLKINGFWLRYSTGSTFDSINSADIKDAIIFLPEKNEQSRIAKTLNCIDNLIAATQCKLDLLKKLKKGYLQKMFC